MLTHSDQTVRNTAKLFQSNGTVPQRMAYRPMTLRSDSAALVAAGGVFQLPVLHSSSTETLRIISISLAHSPEVRLTEPEPLKRFSLVRGRLADGTWHTLRRSFGPLFTRPATCWLPIWPASGTTTDAASFDCV